MQKISSKLVISDSNNTVKIILIVALIVLAIFRILTKTAVNVLLISAPFILLIWGQAVYGIITDINKPNIPQPVKKVFAADKTKPRLVLLIFDEMDQSIGFKNRPKSLQMPNFDRFQAQALHAENAYPPSNQTLSSFPAYIDGKLVTNAVGKDDKLALTYFGENQPVFWGSRPNIFSEAGVLKMNTALVGEFIPYSKLIGKDLTFCKWSMYTYDYGTSGNNVLAHMGSQLYGVLNVLALRYKQHVRAYNEILNHAEKTSRRPEIWFSVDSYSNSA